MKNDKKSRGIRNNNPGNIEYNKKKPIKWQGLDEPKHDGRFCRFITPIYGIRAIARLLITYQDKHKICTIEGIISRYAPSTENNTRAYVRSVVSQTGFDKNKELNLHTYAHLRPIVEAIIYHENGEQPYTDAQITKALVLAGVEPEDDGLSKSRTIKAGRVATAATVLTPITDNIDAISPALPLLQTVAEYAPWVLGIIALSAIGYIFYARMDDKNKGLR